MAEKARSASKVTLEHVAKVVGVSRGTVSKVLNQRSDISESTRAKVLQACDDLGYSHNTKTPLVPPTIAVVADTLSSTYTLEVLKGISAEAQRHDLTITLSHLTLPEEHQPQHTHVPLSAEWMDRVEKYGYLGVVTITSPLDSSLIEHLSQSTVPLVAIDPANKPPQHISSIGSTNWNGGYEATRHLISLGHKRIAYIRGTETSVPSQERYEGYLSALRSSGIPRDETLIVGSGFTYEDGVQAGNKLLELPEDQRPTAIFSCNDMVAIGVYEAARTHGLQIPEDLSVVGYDDTDSARWATPSLTTVRQPLLEMGAHAVRTILDKSHGNIATTSGPIHLTTTLVVRASTGLNTSKR